jgi:hypothetical protein
MGEERQRTIGNESWRFLVGIQKRRSHAAGE